MTENQPKQIYSLLDLEEIFLGAIVGGVTDAEDIFKVKPEFFVHNETKRLAEVCSRVISENHWLDFLAIQTELAQLIGSNESKAYIDRVVSKVSEGYVSSTFIGELEKNYIKRETMKELENARRLVAEKPEDATEIIMQVADKVALLSSIQNDFNLKQDIDDEIEKISNKELEANVIKTGIKGWDDTLGGISSGEVTFIGARPNHGKTSLFVQLALSILDKNPTIKLIAFQLEMPKSAIYQKFIANLSGVSSYKIRLNQLSEEEVAKVKEASMKFNKYKDRLFVYADVYDLITMKKLCKNVGAKIALVDFVTLMDEVSDDKRNDLGKVVKYAKRFAKAHTMGWIFFSQLNRAVEARETKRPEAGDLSESDQLTQLAGDIILLMRPFKYNNKQADYNKLLVIFDKAKYANTGQCVMHFDPDLCIIK